MKNKHTTYIEQNSPQTHMELEFDALGVVGKLVKFVVNQFERKN